MRYFYSMCAIGLYFSSSLSPAQTQKPEPALQALHHTALKTKYLSVDFDHEFYSAFRKRTRSRSGKASFAHPKSFSWAFEDTKHGAEQWFYDGKQLSHYIGREKTVTHYKNLAQFSGGLSQVVQMIMQPGQLLDSYNATQTQEKAGSQSFLLTPKKSKNQDIKQIELTIKAGKAQIQSVTITYRDENQARYKFHNHNQKPLQSSHFRFKNPGGVKVKTLK